MQKTNQVLDELFMQRCFDLARLGAGHVAPNPLVGAVLVYNGRIIGEGWHQKYGYAHAEVNALKSVREEERCLVPDSTLYVSLEPCNIHGNTPPCTDLILRNKIKKVVISCIDHTPGVKGRGVALLEQAGVEVVHSVLEEKGRKISAFRNTFTALERPYIQLKFARTPNGFMGKPGEQVWISNSFSKRLAHKIRSHYDAILVGTQTALIDNPALTNRLWSGKSPLRIVLDKTLKVPTSHTIFNKAAKSWVITELPVPVHEDHLTYHCLAFDDLLPDNLLKLLAAHRVTSLIIEGGAFTLNQFISKNLWDEAWIFTGERLIENGIPAPTLFGQEIAHHKIGSDMLTILKR